MEHTCKADKCEVAHAELTHVTVPHVKLLNAKLPHAGHMHKADTVQRIPMLFLRDPTAKEDGRGMANRQYSIARMGVR